MVATLIHSTLLVFLCRLYVRCISSWKEVDGCACVNLESYWFLPDYHFTTYVYSVLLDGVVCVDTIHPLARVIGCLVFPDLVHVSCFDAEFVALFLEVIQLSATVALLAPCRALLLDQWVFETTKLALTHVLGVGLRSFVF